MSTRRDHQRPGTSLVGSMGRLGLLATAALGSIWLTGCVRSSKTTYQGSAFLGESEPNDAACCADFLGFLSPGEIVTVQGFIDDSGFDPFDGFAFTANQPLTVQFNLFIDNPGADLDFCVYDPQLGFTVDCFESPFNPEFGSIDVFTGGTSFHLVVNSFNGASSYTLQVEVFPLFFGATAGDGLQSLDAPAIQARTGESPGGFGKPDRLPDFDAYGADAGADPGEAEAEPHVIGVLEVLELPASDEGGDGDDDSSQQASGGNAATDRAMFALTSEGHWIRMGRSEEVGAGVTDAAGP